MTEQSGAAPNSQQLAHYGQAGELFAITLVNLLLKVVTAGIYHFWAKTRVRRYVWSHTSFAGENFEYTGHGVQLLKGFIFALIFLSPLALIWGAPRFFPMQEYGQFALLWLLLSLGVYPLLLWLIGFARFDARRYKLGHTRWRGIRFGMTGSARSHGNKMLGQTLLISITFGIYTPYMRSNLTANLLNNSWFGDQRFRYTGTGSGLIKRFWGFVVISILLGAIWGFTVQPFLASLLEKMQSDGGSSGLLLQLTAVAVGLASYVPWAIAWLWFRAGEIRYYVANTTLDDVQYSIASLNTFEFIWLWTSNVGALVLTLGLAYPWVAVRSARYICDHLRVIGELDFASIGQSSEEVLKSGEGLAEALDIGAI
ncbi:MAG: YjgN family protein [SAR324 cluster bacterium]|nr:YjgN family protein [SAR324 cluster bacterium]